MANVRKIVRTPVVLGGIERVHLLRGDCMVGGGCACCVQMCESGDGVASLRLLRLGIARRMWDAHRADLVAEWAAKLDAIDAPGMPCFAQMLFDGAVLPPARAFWPERAKELHSTIARNVALVAEHHRLYGPAA